MFFETVEGDLIPVSRIKRIHAVEGRDFEWMVDLHGGEEVTIGCSAKTALDHAPVASFAAAPGTEVLRVGDGEIFRYAVIGWVLPSSGNPLPVTMDGVNDGGEVDDHVDVLLPDGRVYRPEDATHSLEDFKRLHNVADLVIRIDENTSGLKEMVATTSI